MKYFLFLIWLLNCLTYVHAQQTINDLTVKDLKVVSTTKGSKPCPLMTQTQRDAIASPLNGQCLYNTTTSKLNVYNGSVWKAAGGGVDAWVTSTVYAVGDLVIESNRIYQCLIAHTSGTFSTDLTASRWSEVSAMTGVDLTTNQTINGTKTFSTQLITPLLIGGTGATSTLIHKTTTGVGTTGADHIFQVGNNGAIEAMRVLNNGSVQLNGNALYMGNSSAVNIQGSTDLIFSNGNTNRFMTFQNTGAGTFRFLNGNIGIGTSSPNTNTIIDVVSTTKASRPAPSMTTTQKNALTPVAGGEVYDSTLNIKQYYNGTQWVSSTNIQLDNTYSAAVTTTSGAVTKENKDFISSCTGANPTVCTFNTGYFTVAPNCVAQAAAGSIYTAVANDITSTYVQIYSFTTSSGSAAASIPAAVVCQKQGADYQSTDAYIASNGNYNWTLFTPTLSAGFGTVTSPNCYHARLGSELLLRCNITTGTVVASIATMTLPNSLTTASTLSTYTQVGSVAKGNTGAIVNNIIAAPSSTTINFSGQGLTNSSLTAYNGNDIFTSSTVYSFQARIPIQGWTNSNLIVASLQGTPNIPGLTTAVDTFSFTYGTTNTTTACTASPCFVDQIGGAVTSMTRASTGLYTINLARSYAKVRCTTSTGVGAHMRIQSNGTGSSISLNVSNATEGAQLDNYGTLICQGSY